MHGAGGVVGAQDGAKEAALEAQALHVVLERDLGWLRGEVADDDDGGGDRCDCLRFADPGEDVLVVVIEGDVGSGVDGGIAVVERAELTVPVEEGLRIGVLECHVWVGWVGRGSGFSLCWRGWSVPVDGCCGVGIGGEA